MKKTFTRVICFAITVICLLSVFPIVASASYDVDSTYVMDDLEKLSDFNIEEYTKNEKDDYVSLIAFHEYGYDYNKNFTDYGLFVYLYNPSGKQIYNLSGNKISLKVGNSYKSYDLNLVSFSVESGYEHVFYKFKVQIDSDFIKSLSPTKRVYDINGISIRYKEDEASRKFENEYLFHYTGFDSYHGTDPSNAVSTLFCYSDIEETVSLELHGASWKTATSDKGINHQYEISSVYFAIPNYILDKYGSAEDLYKGLDGITAVWNEYKTNGLITNNATLYADALPFEDEIVPYNDFFTTPNTSIPFCFHMKDCELKERCTFNYSGLRNHTYSSSKDKTIINRLCNVIKITGTEFNDLSAKDTIELLKNDAGDYNSFSFVDDGRIYGYNKHYFSTDDGPLNNQIKTYAASHNDFWTWFIGYGHLNEDNGVSKDIDAFYKVTSMDFEGGSSATNAKKLFMSNEDYINLRTFYNLLDAEEYTVYILRFAVTDYVFGEAETGKSTSLIYDKDYYGTENYYFEKTIFLDFNFLDMHFRDENENVVVLPVDSKPIDIIGSITKPPAIDNDGGFDLGLGDLFNPDPDNPLELLFALLQIFLLILFLVFIVYLFSKVFKIFGKKKKTRRDNSGGVTIINYPGYSNNEKSNEKGSKNEKKKEDKKDDRIIITGNVEEEARLNAKEKELRKQYSNQKSSYSDKHWDDFF